MSADYKVRVRSIGSNGLHTEKQKDPNTAHILAREGRSGTQRLFSPYLAPMIALFSRKIPDSMTRYNTAGTVVRAASVSMLCGYGITRQ